MRYFHFISLFSLLLITACTTTQSINDQSEIAYAEKVKQAYSARVIDTQSHTAKRIHAVFNKMKPYAESQNHTGVPFQWQVTVIRSDELNAWAMPGGKMMFYTGLVDRLNLNDNEIATVMGHEMAHALKEHSKNQMNVGIWADLAVNIGKIALATQGVSTHWGNDDIVDLIKDYGLDKPFSRRNEIEADEEGLFLMAMAGYNPQEAPNLWKKMIQITGGNGGFFSTHPSDESRQANLKRLLPKAMEYYHRSKRYD